MIIRYDFFRREDSETPERDDHREVCGAEAVSQKNQVKRGRNISQQPTIQASTFSNDETIIEEFTQVSIVLMIACEYHCVKFKKFIFTLHVQGC